MPVALFRHNPVNYSFRTDNVPQLLEGEATELLIHILDTFAPSSLVVTSALSAIWALARTRQDSVSDRNPTSWKVSQKVLLDGERFGHVVSPVLTSP